MKTTITLTLCILCFNLIGCNKQTTYKDENIPDEFQSMNTVLKNEIGELIPVETINWVRKKIHKHV